MAPTELFESFISATSAAMGEMAGTEIQAGGVRPISGPLPLPPLSAVVELESGILSAFVLTIPRASAEAFAGRMLAGASQAIDDTLLRDLVSEIANVIAGQTKAMLADTPYRFTFQIPRALAQVDERPPASGQAWFVMTFTSEWGDMTVNLCAAAAPG